MASAIAFFAYASVCCSPPLVSTDSGHCSVDSNDSAEYDRSSMLQLSAQTDFSVPSVMVGPLRETIYVNLCDDENLRHDHIRWAHDSASAAFSWVQTLNVSTVELFEKLPHRPASRPYLAWFHTLQDNCYPDSNITSCRKILLLAERKDFVFVSFDLRASLIDNSHEPLPGVTMAPPPKFFSDNLRVNPEETPKYFLTFRGQLKGPGYSGTHTSTARDDLQRLSSQDQEPGTVVEISTKIRQWSTSKGRYINTYTPEDIERYGDLLNTTFAIVPHGDGRWSYRFTEVVNAYAIPVVISDGLALPYSQLIDWSKAAVIVPESSLKHLSNAQGLVDLLPKDAKTIHAMRKEVRSISQKYFETPSKRWDAMLRSAAAHVKTRGEMRWWETRSSMQ